MILLSQATQAVTSSTNDFWWAQPGATLLGGALVFAAAWVAYSAQAKTREQERTHHRERITEEEKARVELVEAQREEWEARIIHERQEARRTEVLRLYADVLEMAAYSKGWADHGFSDAYQQNNFPEELGLQLATVLAPSEVSLAIDRFADALENRDAQVTHEKVDDLREAIRQHLTTFDGPPRLVSENDKSSQSPASSAPPVTPG